MNRFLFLLSVPLAVTLLVFPAGCRKAAKGKAKERITRVGLAKMVRRTFRKVIPVQGTVAPVNFATLSSKTEGTLDVLQVDEGDKVKKNDLLFQIDKRNLENQVSVAKRQLEVCRSEVKTAQIAANLSKVKLHKAQLDFKRAQTLKKSDAVSQENYESAEVALKDAECTLDRSNALIKIACDQLAQQENNLKIAVKNLADSEIRAPFSGVITEKKVERSEYVKQGTAIIKLEDTSLLQAECFISSIYYNDIRPGKTVAKFRLDGKDAGQAVVTYRSPSVDPMSRTFKIKILLPKNTPLVSGMLCDVDLVLKESLGWGLPSDAVMQRDAGVEAIFCVDKDSKAQMVKIKRGITETEYTEILGGESMKDRYFIVSGQSFINGGDKVVSNRMEK